VRSELLELPLEGVPIITKYEEAKYAATTTAKIASNARIAFLAVAMSQFFEGSRF